MGERPGKTVEFEGPREISFDLPHGSKIVIREEKPRVIDKKIKYSSTDISQALLVIISSTQGIVVTGSGSVDQEGLYFRVEEMIDDSRYQRDGSEEDLRLAVGILASKSNKMNAEKIAIEVAENICGLIGKSFDEKSPQTKNMINILKTHVTQYFPANMSKKDPKPRR